MDLVIAALVIVVVTGVLVAGVLRRSQDPSPAKSVRSVERRIGLPVALGDLADLPDADPTPFDGDLLP